MKEMTLEEIETLFLLKRKKFPNVELISKHYGVTIGNKNKNIPTIYNRCCFVGFCQLGESNLLFNVIVGRTFKFETGLTYAFDNHMYPFNRIYDKEYRLGYNFGKEMREKYLDK